MEPRRELVARDGTLEETIMTDALPKTSSFGHQYSSDDFAAEIPF